MLLPNMLFLGSQNKIKASKIVSVELLPLDGPSFLFSLLVQESMMREKEIDCSSNETLVKDDKSRMLDQWTYIYFELFFYF